MMALHCGRWARALTRLAAIASLGALGACASFDGQPKAALSPAMTSTAGHDVPRSLRTYYSKGDPDARQSYRDEVIGIYMSAADANFLVFKRMLSRESKGTNFGIGSAIAGLTSAATVAAERTAEIMTAGAAGLTGIQGKFSSEVFFAKTLPALFAGMEANRTRVRANIFRRMGEKDSYSLSQAFADIASYEEAGSIDEAIKTMTAETNDRAEVEQVRFENMVGAGTIVSSPTTRSQMRELFNRIDGLVPGRLADLIQISTELNLPTNVDAETQATNIVSKLRDMASADPTALDTFIATMKTKGVDLSQ